MLLNRLSVYFLVLTALAAIFAAICILTTNVPGFVSAAIIGHLCILAVAWLNANNERAEYLASIDRRLSWVLDELREQTRPNDMPGSR